MTRKVVAITLQVGVQPKGGMEIYKLDKAVPGLETVRYSLTRLDCGQKVKTVDITIKKDATIVVMLEAPGKFEVSRDYAPKLDSIKEYIDVFGQKALVVLAVVSAVSKSDEKQKKTKRKRTERASDSDDEEVPKKKKKRTKENYDTDSDTPSRKRDNNKKKRAKHESDDDVQEIPRPTPKVQSPKNLTPKVQSPTPSPQKASSPKPSPHPKATSPQKPPSPEKPLYLQPVEDVSKYACIRDSKRALKPHQIRAVEHMLAGGSLLGCHSTGSGKSAILAVSGLCLLKQHPKAKIYFVTPSGLISNIRTEVEFVGGDPNDERFVFVSHTKFYLDYGRLTPQQLKSTFSNAYLLIDEVHEFRNGGERSKVLVLCASYFKAVLILSATAMVNTPDDLAVLSAMLNKQKTVDLAEFKMITTLALEGEENSIEHLQSLFSCKISFYDAPRQYFPEEIFIIKRFPMTRAYYNSYKEIENLRVKELRVDNSKSCPPGNVFCDKLRGKSLTSFFSGIRVLSNLQNDENEFQSSPKAVWTIDLIEMQRRPTVVFSQFLEAGINQIARGLEKANIPFASIQGKLSRKKRDAAVADFNEGRILVLLLSKAGGTGIDLKAVRTLILFEAAWNEAVLTQARGRAARFHSHTHLPVDQQDVTVYQLLLSKPDWAKDEFPSIDDHLASLALEKNKTINSTNELLKPVSIEMALCANPR